jgi:hypothetical protein
MTINIFCRCSLFPYGSDYGLISTPVRMFRTLHICCTGATARIGSSVSTVIRPRDLILDNGRDFNPPPTLDLARNLHILPPRGIGVVS